MNQYEKMIHTPVEKLIIQLSIPTIISMMVTNVYNLVDTAFVGKLGTSASGAVGIVFGFMAILQAIGFTFGQGSGSIISRKLGNKETSEASKIASTGFFCAFVLAIIASILCFIFIDPLIKLLGSTPTIAPYAKTYVSFILATAPFMVTGFTLNNILRFEGKAMFGMVGLMTGAILNIGGDALFMFVFHMGIAGAGLSTAISQVISFSILLSTFLMGKTQSKISIKNVSLHFDLLSDIVGTGAPSLLRQGLNSITTILLNMEASIYGDAAIAAMSIVSRIFFFVFSVAIGIGQGFQPVSGFNYGAKKYKRYRKAFRFTFLLSEVLMLILGSYVFINASGLVEMLREDIEVIQIGTRALQLQCIAALFLPLCMVCEMALQSTGQKLYALIVSSLRSGAIFIPCLLILAKFRGLAGIQEAQPASYIISFFITLWFIKKFFDSMPKEDS